MERRAAEVASKYADMENAEEIKDKYISLLLIIHCPVTGWGKVDDLDISF